MAMRRPGRHAPRPDVRADRSRARQRHAPEDGSRQRAGIGSAADEPCGCPPRSPSGPCDAVAATADQVATQAAMAVFARGGNAVDAAIAANAAIAVTAPHLCGLGGDLFALVRDARRRGPRPQRQRAGPGRGADADALRADGHRAMPMRHDIRTVDRAGVRRRLGRRSTSASDRSTWRRSWRRPSASPPSGFPASPLLVGSLGHARRARPAERFAELVEQATRPGARVRRPGVALTLRAIGAGGRDAFYGGAFGEGLLGARRRLVRARPTSSRRQADWVEPLRATRVRRRAAHDRAQLAGLPPPRRRPPRRRRRRARRPRRRRVGPPARRGGGDRRVRPPRRAPRGRRRRRPSSRPSRRAPTCVDLERAGRRPVAVDRRRHDVPVHGRRHRHGRQPDPVQRLRLRLVARRADHRDQPPQPRPRLQPRGRGTRPSWRPGGGRRTRCARRWRRGDGALAAVFGTMGGDAQPQILLQVAARLFAGDSGVGRRRRRRPLGAAGRGHRVRHVDERRAAGRRRRGPRAGRLAHRARRAGPCRRRMHRRSTPGSATPTPSWSSRPAAFAAAADPRARVGSAAGL